MNRSLVVPVALLGYALSCAASASAFAEADAFEGKITIKLQDKRGPHMMDYYTKPGLSRMEFDEGQRGKMAMITDQGKQQSYVLMAARQMYIQMPYSVPDKGAPKAKKTGSGAVKTGKTDTVAGQKCEIWTSTDKVSGKVAEMCIARGLGTFLPFRSPMGQSEESSWHKELGEGFFPLRVIERKDGEEVGRMEVTQIRRSRWTRRSSSCRRAISRSTWAGCGARAGRRSADMVTLSPARLLNSELPLRVLLWDPASEAGRTGAVVLGETPGPGVNIPAGASFYVEPLSPDVTDAALGRLGVELERRAISGLSLRGRTQVSNTGLFQMSLAMPGLRFLDLSGTGATPKGLSYFRDPSLLQTLIFQGLEVEKGELAAVAGQWALRYLDLSGLHAPRQTRWDQLRGNLWEGPSLSELSSLLYLRTLRLLDLRGVTQDEAAVAGLRALPELREFLIDEVG